MVGSAKSAGFASPSTPSAKPARFAVHSVDLPVDAIMWVHLAQPAPQPELVHGHVRHTHTDHQREHQPGFPIPGFPLPGPSRSE